MNDYERLLQQVGQQLNYDSLECCMLDEEEAGVEVDVIEGTTTNINEFGVCYLYNVYYDIFDSRIFNVWVADNNIIVKIEEV